MRAATKKQAALRAGRSERTIDRWYKEGHFARIEIKGSRPLFDLDDIDRFLNRNKKRKRSPRRDPGDKPVKNSETRLHDEAKKNLEKILNRKE